jgi:hypothetical protein
MNRYQQRFSVTKRLALRMDYESFSRWQASTSGEAYSLHGRRDKKRCLSLRSAKVSSLWKDSITGTLPPLSNISNPDLCAINRRFHPATQRVKAIIDSGQLGALKSITGDLVLPQGKSALMGLGCEYIISILSFMSLILL